MVKAKSRTAPLVGNGGILGSGIFGLFGSTVTCDSETSSLYCNFVKGFNVLIMLLVILGVLYFALCIVAFIKTSTLEETNASTYSAPQCYLLYRHRGTTKWDSHAKKFLETCPERDAIYVWHV